LVIFAVSSFVRRPSRSPSFYLVEIQASPVILDGDDYFPSLFMGLQFNVPLLAARRALSSALSIP